MQSLPTYLGGVAFKYYKKVIAKVTKCSIFYTIFYDIKIKLRLINSYYMKELLTLFSISFLFDIATNLVTVKAGKCIAEWNQPIPARKVSKTGCPG